MTRAREARWTAADDPQLRRMLATHVHCGEDMQPEARKDAAKDGTEGAAGHVTYRCACGFSFDERAE